MFLAVLSHAHEEELNNNENRVVLKLPSLLAPVKAAVLPLTKRMGCRKAKEIMKSIQVDFNCQYEKKIPLVRGTGDKMLLELLCITVDHQTLQDNTITLRDRDSMNQERIDVKITFYHLKK